MSALAELDRRLTRKIATGRAMQLSPDDLTLFVTTGAVEVFRAAVTKEQVEQCRARGARSQSTSAATSGSIDAPAEPISKSSGTMPPEDVNEALAQARMMTGKAELRSIGST